MKNKNGLKKRTLIFDEYRGEVAPEFDDLSFLDAISRPEELWIRPDIEMLLDARNRVGAVRLPLSSGPSREIVVKEFKPRGFVRLKSLSQSSKAARAWRGAWALKERGLETALPAAYLEKRRRGLVERSYFLAERITGAGEIRGLFRRLGPEELEPLLDALAGHLSLCHDRGILHRDLSDGNILVKKDDSGRFSFYLLDTNRIRLRKRMGAFRRAKNLIRLGVPPALQKKFLLKYAGAKGFRRAHWFWYKWNKSVFTASLGLKKKLRLRRIARFLRIQ
ncbi:MAG: lipopolysaccharide kinase InaA family protein [Candidatus Aminicenantales bacterium]